MTTVVDQVNKRTVDRLLENHPEWMMVLSDYLIKLRNNHFELEHVNVLMQKWERAGYDIYDAFPFSQLWSDLCSAEIVCATIQIGEQPYPNAAKKENDNILKARLFDPFQGSFSGGHFGADGFIDVKKPIKFDMLNRENGVRIIKRYKGEFPLEVGTISAAKTRLYLATEKRIARWPYESNNIYLLQRV